MIAFVCMSMIWPGGVDGVAVGVIGVVDVACGSDIPPGVPRPVIIFAPLLFSDVDSVGSDHVVGTSVNTTILNLLH